MAIPDAPVDKPNPALVGLLGLGIALHAYAWFMVVSVLPAVVRDIGGTTALHWTTTLYMTATIIAGVTVGALKGRYGAAGVFVLGALIFCLGAGLSGTAGSYGQFLIGRGLQGLGEGLVLGGCFALIRDIYPAPMVPRAFGLLAIIFAVAAATAPPLAGILDAGFGWRAVFVLHGIGGVLVMVGAWRLLPGRQSRAGSSASTTAPDSLPPGLAFHNLAPVLLAGSGILAIGLIPHLGSIGMQVLPLLFAPMVCVLALRWDGRLAHPLCPAGLFQWRTPLGRGFWAVLLMPVGAAAVFSHIPLLSAAAFDLSLIVAGQMALIQALAWSAAAWTTARLIKDPSASIMFVIGPPLLICGLTTTALGLSALTEPWGLPGVWVAVAGLVLVGTSFGCSWGFLSQAIMALAPKPIPSDRAAWTDHKDGDRIAALLPTVQNAGWALGGGVTGIAAGLGGLAGPPDMETARWVGPVIMLAGVPFAAISGLAAWSFARSRRGP